MGGRSRRWDPGVRDRVGVGGLTPLSEPMDKPATNGGLAGSLLEVGMPTEGMAWGRERVCGGALARGQGSRLPFCLVAGL